MDELNFTRPPLESLACINLGCDLYGRQGRGNLKVRKVYGKGGIRYLRCRSCQTEFSERKGTALWNCKMSLGDRYAIDEERAIAIAEHLGEGCSFKGTARLVRADPGTVRRLNRSFGQHAQAFHDTHARELVVDSLQADERYGFVGNEQTPAWEAEMMDPASKFVLSRVQGSRDASLIR